MNPSSTTIDPPTRVPPWLRPALWVAEKLTGRVPLPGLLLSHAPRVAVASGLFEALAPHAPRDLDARTLKLVRLTASVVCGCPFCIDMNAAEHALAEITRDELALLVQRDFQALERGLTAREAAAVALARALSCTPVETDAPVRERAARALTPRELVTVAATAAQVNYWARLNQSLGVPAAGFFFAPGSACDRLARP